MFAGVAGSFTLCLTLSACTLWSYTATIKLEDMPGTPRWPTALSFMCQVLVASGLVFLLVRDDMLWLHAHAQHATSHSSRQRSTFHAYQLACTGLGLTMIYFSGHLPSQAFTRSGILTEKIQPIIPGMVWGLETYLLGWPTNTCTGVGVLLVVLGGLVVTWVGFGQESASSFSAEVWLRGAVTCASASLFLTLSRRWADSMGLTECGLMWFVCCAAVVPVGLHCAMENHLTMVLLSPLWHDSGFVLWFVIHMLVGMVRMYVLFLCIRANSPLATAVTKIVTDVVLLATLPLSIRDFSVGLAMTSTSLIRHCKLSFEKFAFLGALVVLIGAFVIGHVVVQRARVRPVYAALR